MKKLIFTFTKADQKTRIMGCIALALAVVAILMLGISASKAINGAIIDFPFFEVLSEEMGYDDFEEAYEDFIDEIEDAIDDDDEDKIEEIEDDFDMSADEILDLMDPLSLKSMQIMFESSGNDEGALVFSVLISFITYFAGLLILFVALSALFMNKGFFITAAVLSFIHFTAFAGTVWFFIFLALCIAYCILVSKVRTAYIVYKHAPAPVAEPEPEATEEQNV